MANLTNTTISGTGHLTPPVSDTFKRSPNLVTTAVQWTTSGYSVLSGITPTASSTTWTCPTGVSQIEVLVVGGGGSGGNCQNNGGTPGGGGGAGGLVYRSDFPVVGGTQYNITVGTGGAAVTSANIYGNNGLDSFFGSSANLVSNGSFTSNVSGWTVPSAPEGTFTWSSGAGLLTNSTSADPPVCAYQALTGLTIGRKYLVVGTKTAGDTAVVNITENFSASGGTGGPGNVLYWNGVLSQGRKAGTFVATQTTMYITLRINTNTAPTTVTFDDIGVYDLTTALVAIGGGGGGSDYTSGVFGTGDPARRTAFCGGSGGGGSNNFPQAATGSLGQGQAGGSYNLASGGGGAAQPGGDGRTGSMGGGGNGLGLAITGTLTYYAGGGGAGAYNGNNFPGAGGLGGGGRGAYYTGAANANAIAGTANTGGGGGGGAANGGATSASGAGGSGVVVIRYVQTTDSLDIRGSLRYNTDLTDLEAYENHTKLWSAQDQSRNFAGHNLRTYSEDLSQFGASYYVSKSYNQTIAPDGTTTADLLTETATTSGARWIEWPNSYTANLDYTLSAFCKPNGRNFAQIYGFADNGVFAGQTIVFNCSGSGSVSSSTGTVVQSDIVALANGWYRISATLKSGATNTGYWKLGFQNDAAATSYSGNGTSGMYFWGVQIEQASKAGTYTKTDAVAAPTPGVFGDFRIHRFTSTGTTYFTPANSGFVELLVVGGGGGGGSSIYGQGGAGAGGVVYHKNYPVVAGRTYTVTVGAGGSPSNNGSNSVFGPIVAIGGGTTGNFGGSGGGGGHSSPAHPGGGAVIGQGNPGGYHVYSSPYPCGGGGGAGGRGGDGNTSGGPGPGGPGLPFDITGSTVYYGGGGGATQYNATGSSRGGIGGGGDGVYAGTGTSGLANTGGGGGAGGGNGVGGSGGSGGSGIVVVRYRYN